jgi:tyrosinase
MKTSRSDLSVDERKEYVRAVLCLQSKPPRAPKDKAPGSLSRFDDFVATHMTMAGMLHSPTNLFAAHRYFIHVYEKALRDECGYKGSQPVRLRRLCQSSTRFSPRHTSLIP